ncbi:MAG: family 43 glycosylhydrolase, partial [Gemmatimonadota bacterium]|nr:family 43 glycosylhydrolase [Gemmatimonadota bacterium]
WWNELYSQFRYTELEGLDYRGGDGRLTRRDPSKVIKADGKYYVWYTRRNTDAPPQGPGRGAESIPSTDWDLSEIWYATSEDGFVWEEQGVAVPRPAKPHPGWRSVSTPDILVWKDRYYLYYQSFLEMSGTRGDDCPVSVSYADSPNGPWTPTQEVVIPNGPKGSWDQFSIHDPYPLVYKGRIYLYYKSDMNAAQKQNIRLQGLAIADDPLGPFEKCPLNPVLNSGHETGLFPFKGGIAALAIRHGNEHNTIQFAPDGINFEIASTVSLMPIAPGPYVPDAFTNTDNGRGITWGLCHFTGVGKHSILARFDCDLSQDHDAPNMRQTEHWWPPEYYYKSGLGEAMRREREQLAREDLKKT